MYIIEDLNFDNIQHDTVSDNFINELNAKTIAEQIYKEINSIDSGVFYLGIGKPEELITYNKNTHMLEISGNFSIYSNHLKKLPEWCKYVYFNEITISKLNIRSIEDIENFPQYCKTFIIENCDIQTLQGMPEYTTELIIYNCDKLNDIDGISSNVKKLSIKNCSNLLSLEGGEKLQLTQLSLQQLWSLHTLYGINHNIIELYLVEIFLFVKHQFECVNIYLNRYFDKINSKLLESLPKCRKLAFEISDVSSLEGINDDIKELYINNYKDLDEFILEEHLPWNLETLAIAKYDMNINHFNRTNNSFMFPETLKTVLISQTTCKNIELLKTHILSKTNVKFDNYIPYTE